MTTDDSIALIDLDDTVADYSRAIRKQMSLMAAPGEPPYADRQDPEPLHLEFRRKTIQGNAGFWRNLKPIDLGFQVVNELRKADFELHVLTKGPRRNTNAWSEKVEWVNEYLPDAEPHITSDKSLVYGRVLFDDWPPYFTEWLRVRPRGLVICLAQAWNQDYEPGGTKEHPNVIRYDGANMRAVRRAITAAAGRSPGAALNTA